MKELNLNIDHWSMVSESDPSEAIAYIADVIAMTDIISWTNSEDNICDFNMHEYTH